MYTVRHNQLSFWPVWQLWLFGRNPPAQLVNRIFDEKYVGLNKLQMMPRPNTSNLIEVLNTQALTEKSSDKISLSQNPDKSGRKLVILPTAWQEWKETCDFDQKWKFEIALTASILDGSGSFFHQWLGSPGTTIPEQFGPIGKLFFRAHF